MLEQAINELNASIKQLIELMSAGTAKPSAKAEKKAEPEKVETPKAAEKLPTLDDVQKALAAAVNRTSRDTVKELVSGYGAKKAGEIPEAKYAEVIVKAEALGVN